MAATWTDVGKTSLEDCEALTWSFGWTTLSLPAACEGARCELGDDLVGVHVRGRAGAGLEDVDREVAVVLAGGHLIGSVGDRLGELAVEHPQFGVGLCSCLLDPGQRLDVGALQGLAGDGEVLHCTLRLGAVQGVHGDADFAHRVMFNAELCQWKSWG